MAYNDRYANNNRDNGRPSTRELATTIMVQQYAIDPNNPPSVPNIPVPPELQDVFEFICGTVANVLTKSIEVTPAHLFLYNIAAVGNFGNADFDDIVKVAVTSIDSVMRNTNPPPEIIGVINAVSQDVIDGAAALTANGNRELGGFLTEADWRILDTAAAVYEDLKRMSQTSRRSYSGGARQSYSSTSNRITGRPGRVGVEPPAQREAPQRQSGPLTVNEAARRRSAPQTSRTQTVQPAAPVQPVVVAPLHWRSTVKQPYLPAYNVVAKEEVMQATSEGVISVNKPRTVIMEDYNSHCTKMGARAVFGDQKARNLHVDVVLREAEAAAITESITLNTENLPAVYANSGMFNAQLMLDYAINWSPDKRQAGATSHGGVVHKPVLLNGQGAETETYAWMATARNMEILSQRVRLMLSNGSDKYSLCGEQARALDAQLTRGFNRILHRQLAISPSELYIESFATDIEEVMTILNTRPIYAPAFKGIRLVEKEFIARNTFILAEQYREAAVRNVEEIRMPRPALSDEDKASLVFQAVPTVGVLLAVCADELSIDIGVGETRALIASEHRQLATLASTLVDMVNPITETGSAITLTTLDSYHFELDKGLLGDHFYLVTRVR